MVSLARDVGALRADFNAARSKTRFVAVLSPTCPACVHGAAAIRQALLEAPEAADIPIFIVWTPMVPGDDAESARRAMGALRSPRVHHYDDPENRLGRLLRDEVFPNAVADMRASLPPGHYFADVLRDRPSATPEWDLYMCFDPQVRWGDAMPVPSRWVRQIARFAETPGGELHSLMWRNAYGDPPVEGDLAEEIGALARPGPSKDGR